MGKRARAWADPLTRENRRQLRAQVGPLRTARVRPRTLSRYVHAVYHFYIFALMYWGAVAPDWESIDRQAQAFLEFIWSEGEGRSLAGDVLSGIQCLLNSRRQLPGAWKLLSVWSSLEIPARGPPFLLEVLRGLVKVALACGLLGIA